MVSDDTLSAFTRDLEAETPSDLYKTRQYIAEAFPVIEKHLSRKLPLGKVLLLFKARYRVEISTARFRQLLKEERARCWASKAREQTILEGSHE